MSEGSCIRGLLCEGLVCEKGFLSERSCVRGLLCERAIV